MNVVRETRRRRLLLLVCALLIAIPPAVAYAGSFNYVDSAFFGPWQTGETSGSTARQYNKVWRPVGNEFGLYYRTSNEFIRWTNTWSNPFTVSEGHSNAYAGCENLTPGTVSPVTCQTTRP